MFYPARTKRTNRRGGILAGAMLFFVMVTVAGTAILSMSTIQRLKTIRNGIDVRLMIAAEAGMESVRGRFTLVAGVQDDWSWLTTGVWTDIGTVSINGINVQLQANLMSGNSVPSARIRGIASASGKTRVVEQRIKVASFSDYALYSGSTGDAPIGANFKMVGTFYSRGNINLLGNTGIEFFGKAYTSGVVTNYPSPGISQKPFIFLADVDEHSPVIDLPPSSYGADPIKVRAQQLTATYAGSAVPGGTVPSAGFVFYRNTESLTFSWFDSGGVQGTRVTRSYWRRNTGTETYYISSQYTLVNEVTTLPQSEEICIYVDTDQPPSGTDTLSGGRNYRPATSQVNISGTIRNSRITVYAEKDVHIVNNVAYYSLLANPSARLPANKQSSAALDFPEMLGICADNEVRFNFGSFTPLTSASTGYVSHAGNKTYQYMLDGVFQGTYRAYIGTTPAYGYNSCELWVCGGLINTTYNTTGFGSYFNPRHYDWDWRLQGTTPPFFLRAYNVTATFVPGTWRTYEL
jgi:hypothetical protein